MRPTGSTSLIPVQRVQTGIRMEKRILKVLKALAEHREISLGDLLEGIVLYAFEGRSPFSPDTLNVVAQLRGVYGLDLGADATHRLTDPGPAPSTKRRAARRKRRGKA